MEPAITSTAKDFPPDENCFDPGYLDAGYGMIWTLITPVGMDQYQRLPEGTLHPLDSYRSIASPGFKPNEVLRQNLEEGREKNGTQREQHKHHEQTQAIGSSSRRRRRAGELRHRLGRHLAQAGGESISEPPESQGPD